MAGTLECKESHNMTLPEYKLKYPGVALQSDKMIARIKTTKKKADFFFVQEETIPQDVITDEQPKPEEKISLIDLGNEIVKESNSILSQIERSPIINKNLMPKIEELDLAFTDKLEEFKQEKNRQYDNSRGLIPKDKLEILNYLLTEFEDVVKNHFVESFLEMGRLSYRYVTDISLVDRMIDIEFPNAFWHNMDVAKPSRDSHLMKDGWKIIDINSRMPKVEDVRKELQKHDLIS